VHVKVQNAQRLDLVHLAALAVAVEKLLLSYFEDPVDGPVASVHEELVVRVHHALDRRDDAAQTLSLGRTLPLWLRIRGM